MKRLSIAVLLCALAACDPVPEPAPLPTPVPPAAQDTCTAAPYAALVGQDATALERELIMRPVRVIRPGMAVTMDYRPNRLNFEVGPGGRITRIYCG